jgi:DNA-binding response OmpR family regulator
MTAPRILLVDDQLDVIWLYQYALQRAGYTVATARDGQSALDMALHHAPDLIVLDIAMPGMNGIELCKQLRSTLQLAGIPILFLSAHHQIADRVTGLDAGADDYLIKPCEITEFLARIRARLRRRQAPPDQPGAAVQLNPQRLQVVIAGRQHQLTKLQFQLLSYMVEHAGVPLSAQRLLHDVWGYRNEDDTNTVRFQIKKLREKLQVDGTQPDLIRTIRGLGYQFDMPAGDWTAYSSAHS